jgi:dolichol-phosphate mannosyltransferase
MKRIAVVIPCYRVRTQVVDVIRSIPQDIGRVYVVDDACPEHSGELVKESCKLDARVRVITHEKNQGVGGAVCSGYAAAIADGMDVVVKLDGDGQMDPRLIPILIDPILRGEADYTKGNRFYALESLRQMPFVRLIGNAGLSFMIKAMSGYWTMMDPTNGFTAITKDALKLMPLPKIERRYFFETDMLFRLATIRAVVVDVPMDAVYAGEVSSLSVKKVLLEFPPKIIIRLWKRLFYNYLIRDFTVCTIEFVAGIVALLFGLSFGLHHWWVSVKTGVVASTGTVMLSALPFMIGVQLLLSAIAYDVGNTPKRPISR